MAPNHIWLTRFHSALELPNFNPYPREMERRGTYHARGYKRGLSRVYKESYT